MEAINLKDSLETLKDGEALDLFFMHGGSLEHYLTHVQRNFPYCTSNAKTYELAGAILDKVIIDCLVYSSTLAVSDTAKSVKDSLNNLVNKLGIKANDLKHEINNL